MKRVLLGWDAVIGGWDVPRWLSPVKDLEGLRRRFGTVIQIAAPICVAYGLLTEQYLSPISP